MPSKYNTYFDISKKDGKNFAKCLEPQCGYDLSWKVGGSNYCLRAHLENKHKSQYKKLIEEEEKEAKTIQKAFQPTQLSVANMFRAQEKSENQTDEPSVKRKLFEYVVQSNRSHHKNNCNVCAL
ncbi:hypothetical protein Ddc_18066 [Ditylenchus destructor]|nr:hypothetical protein Ddc_18066 [Ditylenchus destructor]